MSSLAYDVTVAVSGMYRESGREMSNIFALVWCTVGMVVTEGLAPVE